MTHLAASAAALDMLVDLLPSSGSVSFETGDRFEVNHDTRTVTLPVDCEPDDVLRGLLQLDHGKGYEDDAEQVLMRRRAKAKDLINLDTATEVLRAHNTIEEDEMVTHGVLVTATVRFDDQGRRISNCQEIYLAGLDPWMLRGLLQTALENNSVAERRAKRSA